MARYYNKDKLKEKLDPDKIFDLLNNWSGNPEWKNNCIVSDTICHNLPGEGSHKLYYYFGTKLFKCFTGESEAFDIFDLCIKVMAKQYNLSWELYDAMNYIARYFGFEGETPQLDNKVKELDDWNVFERHKVQINQKQLNGQLKSYSPIILERFSYPRILNWEKEGINQKVIRENLIGYYPARNQITIPHFDINNRLIGIRGRTLSEEDAERYGKYRPLLIGKQLYSHPLSLNLYHLNQSKENIRRSKTAIIFESEKATMLYQSYYGKESDISVACCGQNISNYQMQLLKDLGCKEVIIGFDKDYEVIGDDTFKRIKSKLIHLYNRYNNTIKISAIFDKDLILPQKASPIDVSKEVFEELLNKRIIPKGE